MRKICYFVIMLHGDIIPNSWSFSLLQVFFRPRPFFTPRPGLRFESVTLGKSSARLDNDSLNHAMKEMDSCRGTTGKWHAMCTTRKKTTGSFFRLFQINNLKWLKQTIVIPAKHLPGPFGHFSPTPTGTVGIVRRGTLIKLVSFVQMVGGLEGDGGLVAREELSETYWK